MVLFASGFVTFCIGGTLFQKGGIDRSPGQVVSVSLGVRAFSVGGISLMAVGGLLMIAAGF